MTAHDGPGFAIQPVRIDHEHYGIEKGIQVAQLDQRWPDQAAFGSVACAQFLANGVILPNTQTLKAVMKDGVEQARKELGSTMGQ